MVISTVTSSMITWCATLIACNVGGFKAVCTCTTILMTNSTQSITIAPTIVALQRVVETFIRVEKLTGETIGGNEGEIGRGSSISKPSGGLRLWWVTRRLVSPSKILPYQKFSPIVLQTPILSSFKQVSDIVLFPSFLILCR